MTKIKKLADFKLGLHALTGWQLGQHVCHHYAKETCLPLIICSFIRTLGPVQESAPNRYGVGLCSQ